MVERDRVMAPAPPAHWPQAKWGQGWPLGREATARTGGAGSGASAFVVACEAAVIPKFRLMRRSANDDHQPPLRLAVDATVAVCETVGRHPVPRHQESYIRD